MMNKRFTIVAALMCCVGLAQAQDYGLKVGLTRYTSHSATSGIQGIGVPPGADAVVGDASTAIFAIERRRQGADRAQPGPHAHAELLVW